MENFIDKVAWIYIKDKKLLGAKSFNKIPFYIPGGKREENESDIETLLRELKEELSINFDINTAKLFGIYSAQAHGKPEGVKVRMTCYTGDFTGEIKAASEIEKIGWLESKHINTDLTSPVDKIILEDLKSKDLID